MSALNPLFIWAGPVRPQTISVSVQWANVLMHPHPYFPVFFFIRWSQSGNGWNVESDHAGMFSLVSWMLWHDDICNTLVCYFKFSCVSRSIQDWNWALTFTPFSSATSYEPVLRLLHWEISANHLYALKKILTACTKCECSVETITLGDKRIGIRTSLLEEKATACSMLCCYADELKEGFFPWIDQVMLSFFFLDSSSLSPFTHCMYVCAKSCSWIWICTGCNYSGTSPQILFSRRS